MYEYDVCVSVWWYYWLTDGTYVMFVMQLVNNMQLTNTQGNEMKTTSAHPEQTVSDTAHNDMCKLEDVVHCGRFKREIDGL